LTINGMRNAGSYTSFECSTRSCSPKYSPWSEVTTISASFVQARATSVRRTVLPELGVEVGDAEVVGVDRALHERWIRRRFLVEHRGAQLVESSPTSSLGGAGPAHCARSGCESGATLYCGARPEVEEQEKRARPCLFASAALRSSQATAHELAIDLGGARRFSLSKCEALVQLVALIDVGELAAKAAVR
jgi:hypothetical protein